MCIWGVWGGGMLCMYRLKSVGDSTDPWGTPSEMFLVFDDWPANDTWACLPAK